MTVLLRYVTILTKVPE